jgi:hypothetical protein
MAEPSVDAALAALMRDDVFSCRRAAPLAVRRDAKEVVVSVESDRDGSLLALLDVGLARQLAAAKACFVHVCAPEDDGEAFALATCKIRVSSREELARRREALCRVLLWQHRVPLRYTLQCASLAGCGRGSGGGSAFWSQRLGAVVWTDGTALCATDAVSLKSRVVCALT